MFFYDLIRVCKKVIKIYIFVNFLDSESSNVVSKINVTIRKSKVSTVFIFKTTPISKTAFIFEKVGTIACQMVPLACLCENFEVKELGMVLYFYQGLYTYNNQ